MHELAAQTVPDEVYDRHVKRPDLPALLAALRNPARTDTEKRLQENVCIVLEHVKPPQAIPVLLRCLEETPRARVRRAVLRVLAALPPDPTPKVCQLLLKCLHDERDEPTRQLAASALGRLKDPPPHVVSALELRVYDSRRSVQRAAARALGQLKRPCESTLQALEDLAGEEWTTAVDALLRLAPSRATPFLLQDATHRAFWRMDRLPELRDYLAQRAMKGDELSQEWGDLRELARFQLEANLRRQLPRVRAQGLLTERGGDPLAWADRLASEGLETAARAGVAAARTVLYLWTDQYPDDFPPMDALWLTERWLIDPSRPVPQREFGISQFCTPGSFAAGWACRRAGEIPGGGPLREAVMWAIRARMGSTGIVPVGGAPEDERLPLEVADDLTRAAIARELAPWQAGQFDPLAEVARQRHLLVG